jgi:hypothetical protein
MLLLKSALFQRSCEGHLAKAAAQQKQQHAKVEHQHVDRNKKRRNPLHHSRLPIHSGSDAGWRSKQPPKMFDFDVKALM